MVFLGLVPLAASYAQIGPRPILLVHHSVLRLPLHLQEAVHVARFRYRSSIGKRQIRQRLFGSGEDETVHRRFEGMQKRLCFTKSGWAHWAGLGWSRVLMDLKGSQFHQARQGPCFSGYVQIATAESRGRTSVASRNRNSSSFTVKNYVASSGADHSIHCDFSDTRIFYVCTIISTTIPEFI